MPDSPRIVELKRRVQSDPASIAFAALAEEFRRTGRYEEAIALCRTGLERHPSYISAHVTLGRALIEVGQYDEAREELEHVLRVAPENLAAIRGLAEIHHRHRQTSETNRLSASAVAEMAAALAPVERPAEAAAPPQAVTPPKISTPSVIAFPKIVPSLENIALRKGPVPAEDLAPAEQIAVPGRRAPVEEVARPDDITPPPPVPIRVVPQANAPRPDPVLEGLEAFLHAIVRARQSADRLHLS